MKLIKKYFYCIPNFHWRNKKKEKKTYLKVESRREWCLFFVFIISNGHCIRMVCVLLIVKLCSEIILEIILNFMSKKTKTKILNICACNQLYMCLLIVMCIVFTATFGTIWKDPSTTSDVNREENLIKRLKKNFNFTKKIKSRVFGIFQAASKGRKSFWKCRKILRKKSKRKKN